MIIKLFKFLFGNLIGLDKIPEKKRDKFVKEILIPLLKEAVSSAIASGGKEVSLKYRKAF